MCFDSIFHVRSPGLALNSVASDTLKSRWISVSHHKVLTIAFFKLRTKKINVFAVQQENNEAKKKNKTSPGDKVT